MSRNFGYELDDLDTNDDQADVYMGDVDAETTRFIDDGDPEEIRPYETPKAPSGSKISAMQREIKKQEVKKLFEYMDFDETNIDLNLDLFRVKNDKGMNILEFQKNNRWFNLTRKDNGEFKTPGEINKIFTKRNLRQLGLIKSLDINIPTPREVANMEPDKLKEKLNIIRNILNEMPPMRELQGLEEALQRIDGDFLNSAGKLTELKEDIVRQQNKLKEPTITANQREAIQKRLKGFQDEYKVRLESLSLQKKELQSQFARIRQTLNKIADKDRSLKERLNILWREQGLTIVSVLTAVGLTISTLVLALIPRGGAAGGAGGSGSNPHRVRDWVKRGLKALARVFGRIAKWALAALPGAIGSIISWIFSLLKTVVTKAGEHAYAVVGFIAVFISYFFFKNQTSPTNARLPNKTRL